MWLLSTVGADRLGKDKCSTPHTMSSQHPWLPLLDRISQEKEESIQVTSPLSHIKGFKFTKELFQKFKWTYSGIIMQNCKLSKKCFLYDTHEAMYMYSRFFMHDLTLNYVHSCLSLFFHNLQIMGISVETKLLEDI